GFGIGNESFDRLVQNGRFVGATSQAVFGGSVPMEPGAEPGHWADNTRIDGQTANMVATIPPGEVQPLTRLDFAALDDIGWDLVSRSPPVPPPEVPPEVPPPVPPPGTGTPIRFAVGADSGTSPSIASVNANGEFIDTNSPFAASFFGGTRVATGDFNRDGVLDIVSGTGPGAITAVVVQDGVTFRTLITIEPFEESFVGGVYVAAGDVTGDGVADLVITPDEGGGPRADVYSGATFTKFASFFGIDDPNFRGGARPALADFNGDNRDDLIIAAGFGGGPRIAGFSGASLSRTPTKLFGDFFAFEQGLRNGVFVAAGDVNGDGRADLIVGGGPGGGPRVQVFSGSNLIANQYTVLANFFAGDRNSRGGIRVAATDLDGDSRVDVVTGAGENSGSRLSGYRDETLGNPVPEAAFDFDFYPGFTGGIFVG
ncbi:MAG: FG-GAP-like repeat-containing protein, partial [Gemmataceae bacterium]